MAQCISGIRDGSNVIEVSSTWALEAYRLKSDPQDAAIARGGDQHWMLAGSLVQRRAGGLLKAEVEEGLTGIDAGH